MCDIKQTPTDQPNECTLPLTYLKSSLYNSKDHQIFSKIKLTFTVRSDFIFLASFYCTMLMFTGYAAIGQDIEMASNVILN